MARLYGERPRPWVLVFGVDPTTDLGVAIRGLVPTVEFCARQSTAGVHQAEFDAAVVIGDPPDNLSGHLNVVQFGGRPSAETQTVTYPLGGGQSGIHFSFLDVGSGVGARQFTVDDGAEEEDVANLARDLIPPAGSDYATLRWHGGDGPEAMKLTPFASDIAGHPLAGRLRRGATDAYQSELWWLPDVALVRAAEWTAAALRRWTRLFADRFPTGVTWPTEADWMTHEEHLAQNAVAEHAAHANQVIEQLATKAEQLAIARTAARDAGDEGERRLLTCQGDPLVSEVVVTLKEFGFTVVEADHLTQNAAGKQEDLRVGTDAWLCLAEVKGYANRNAKASDLAQVNKAVEVFVKREGKWPDARWYVVNQSFKTPPGQRSRPLTGAVELELFADSGGLVIDTRDLFRLRRSVQAGELQPKAAAGMLQRSVGVFDFPGGPEENSS